MLDLYHHGSSVCAAKVRFALGEKGLAWQGHYLDILKGDQFAPEYQKLNPKAVVPTLVHDGHVIVESTVINEYIDESFPDVRSSRSAGRARRDAAVDQGGRRESASGLRRDHVRLVPPAHRPPAAGGQVSGVPQQHAADLGDGALA